MKKILLSAILIVSAFQFLTAQVPLTPVVEHFTNTRCGICASRNPGLFTNLASNPSVLHIAVHPSSPYSSCLLYQHNPTENNARTNYYGILGGTPRIVINGTVVNGSFTSSTLFDTFITKTTPIAIDVKHTLYGTDSIVATVTIKAVAAHNLGSVQLYVPLVEDSLNYSAPNGENLHHNVFRKVFTNSSIMAPANGDSLVLNYTLTGNTSWNFSSLKAMAIIQETASKRVIQAAESKEVVSNVSTTAKISPNLLNISPNPISNGFTLKTNDLGSLKIYNAKGQLIQNVEITSLTQYISTSKLKPGIYTAMLSGAHGTQKQKLVIL